MLVTRCKSGKNPPSWEFKWENNNNKNHLRWEFVEKFTDFTKKEDVNFEFMLHASVMTLKIWI